MPILLAFQPQTCLREQGDGERNVTKTTVFTQKMMIWDKYHLDKKETETQRDPMSHLPQFNSHLMERKPRKPGSKKLKIQSGPVHELNGVLLGGGVQLGDPLLLVDSSFQLCYKRLVS